jgi:phosphatidylserine/phosphatidylglycerophosphate/cardiolipin synthase-like enzyme
MGLQSGRLTPPFEVISLRRYVGSEVTDQVLSDLRELANQGFTPQQIATTLNMLRSYSALNRPVSRSVDLVTTGPGDLVAGNRDTSVVVRNLFASATQSVIVAGYVVYQGQRVFQSLADRMLELPELKVRLYLDIQRNAKDTSAEDQLIARFAYRFRDTQWPKDRPMPEIFCDKRSLELDGSRTSLHAKCIVIDQKKTFVSSANFTEAAQLRNIEVGVVIDDMTIARRLTEFFESMARSGSLIRIF